MVVSAGRFERPVSSPPDWRFRQAKLRAAGGAPGRTSTGDLRFTRPLLLRLSYRGQIGVLGPIRTAVSRLGGVRWVLLSYEDVVPPPASTQGPRPSDDRALLLSYGGMVVGRVGFEPTSADFQSAATPISAIGPLG